MFCLSCNVLFPPLATPRPQDYSTDGMSNKLMDFVQHLREFGLLYQRRRTAGRFYPTR